jgi:hypothetical protein
MGEGVLFAAGFFLLVVELVAAHAEPGSRPEVGASKANLPSCAANRAFRIFLPQSTPVHLAVPDLHKVGIRATPRQIPSDKLDQCEWA